MIEAEPPDWISKSRIQSFKYCDRQYYYFAILQLPFTASPAMIKGRKFHFHSSNFYVKVNINEPPTYEYYRTLMPKDPDKPTNELYDNFAKFEVERMLEILNSKLSPEHYFLPIINEVRIKLPEQKLSGHIDRAWLLSLGKIYGCVIIEIKSGWIANKTSLRRETCFYKYLIDESELLDYIGVSPNYIGAYSPLGNSYWYEKISKRSMNALFNTLDQITHAQLTRRTEEDWPKNANANCTFCPYIQKCWL